jgi:hypothetical protein
MKKSILLYLVVLAGLFNIFTYAWFTKDQAFEKQRYEILDKKLNDSIAVLNNNLFDANYFSLETNDNAQNYFENKQTGEFLNYKKLIPFVKDQLISFNDNPEGNPYTGFEKISERKFIINKAKVLNHRWIIADFNDGTTWGEALVKYFINDDKIVDFEVSETVLYTKR